MIRASQRGWVGVDLGSHAVKVAQLERRRGQLALVAGGLIHRRQAWSFGSDADSYPPEPSHDELRIAMSLSGPLRGRLAAAVLPMAISDCCECAISREGILDARDIVAQEFETLDNDTDEGREFDYWSTGSTDRSGNSAVLALSVRSDWSRQVAGDLAQAGLRAQVLDGLPLALARAVEMGDNRAGADTLAAVDWGHQRATFCVVRKGLPKFVRCLRNSCLADVVQAVCKSLAVSQDEAHKLLVEHGLPDQSVNHTKNGSHERDDLTHVIEEVTTEPLRCFLDELRRTIAFLRQQRRDCTPTRMILLGGGATIRNIDRVLGRKIDLPVERWRFGSTGRLPPNWSFPVEVFGPAMALSTLAWSR